MTFCIASNHGDILNNFINKKMSKQNKILDHLMKWKSITPLEALSEYGCFRLSSRIFDLRSEGYPIKMVLVYNIDTGSRYAKYWMDFHKLNLLKKVSQKCETSK